MTIAAPDCPRCGAPMVRRAVRRGPRAGLEMWGCSRWPTCEGAINIDPEPPRADPTDPTTRPVAGEPGAYLQARFDREREWARLKRRALLPLTTSLAVVVATLLFFAFQPVGVWAGAIAAVVGGGAIAFAILRLPFESLVWAKGIEGEKAAAEYLAPLEAEGHIVLNNRRIPGAKGDIDHVIVGPTGIAVIETKRWGGKLEVHNDRLFVGDHDRTWAVEQLYREALAVQLALSSELTHHRVTVTPILCAIGGVARGARMVGGVAISDGRNLASLLRDRPIVFDEAQVLELARAADERLRLIYPWEAS